MEQKHPQLLLQTSPFLNAPTTTPELMGDVLIALAPVAVAAVWFFGVAAFLILATSVIGAVATEWFLGPNRRSVWDGSAALTGLILGLTLPPTLPLWMALLGSVVAIGLGKLVWGGMGHNLFNPALVGRAFLQAAFPTALTTWVPPAESGQFFNLGSTTLAAPLMHAKIDGVTAATPLALMKFDHVATDLWALLSGHVAGSLGETSAGLIVLGGVYMLVRRTFDWRIPASILLTVLLFSGALYMLSPDRYPQPAFMLLSGGLMFGAIFMATDPVSSPLSPKGAWLFGGGIGVLVVLIRLFGGLPEGVMYAILLMNAVTPLIERVTQPTPIGRKVHE